MPAGAAKLAAASQRAAADQAEEDARGHSSEMSPHRRGGAGSKLAGRGSGVGAREETVDAGEDGKVKSAVARKGGKKVLVRKGAERVAVALQKLQHMDADIKRRFKGTRH